VTSVGVLGLIDWTVLPSVTLLVGLNAALFLLGLGILFRVRSEFQ